MGGTVVLGVSAYLLFFPPKKPDPHIAISNQQIRGSRDQAKTIESGLPVRLVIPKLDIDAKILYMGLTADDDMDVAENNFKDVGWYQYGARPGNKGTAVIAGHVNGAHERGVFIDLDTLKIDDIVRIIDDKNQTISFIVRDIRTYDQDDRPDEVFHSSEGTHLNLITCAGSWNAAEQRFPVRLVVFTEKVS